MSAAAKVRVREETRDRDVPMCESKAEGGRRCLDYRRLVALSAGQVAPAHREDGVPDVDWAASDLSGLWDGARGPGHQALGAALDRLLSDRAVEPAITDALRDGLPPGARLHGLAFRMKSPASTAGKVARKRHKGELDRVTVGRFTDTLRYTVCTERHDDIVPAARRVLAELVARGMVVVEASDRYRDGAPYKGLHFLVREGGGTTFEVQVHSELSQQVKDEVHLFYEVSRDPDTPDDEADAALARCVELSRQAPTPTGLDDVSEFEGCPLEHV